jgi:hypothetical protein
MPAEMSTPFVKIELTQSGPKPIIKNPLLRSQHLDVTVNEFCSFGTLTIRFRNPFDQPVEMLYAFPLLDGGAVVTGIKTEWDGQIIEGVVRDSKTGKEEYKNALSKGYTAAMVEHSENDLFFWRLGGIPAGADVCVTSRFVGPINLTKKAGKRAQTQFNLTLPTTVPPWYNRAGDGDAALAHAVANVKGFKALTQDELSALTVDKLRKRLQLMTKTESTKETGEKLRKEVIVNRLLQLQQDRASADRAAAETQAAIAQEVSLAIPPFSAVVRSKFVTKEFQSVVVTSPTHGSPSSQRSSGPELIVEYENLFATPLGADQSGPSNLQFRWCIEGLLPNIACCGRVLAGAGQVASMSEASADIVVRDQSATRALMQAARALSGGPLAAEAVALAEKSSQSERAFEEVVGLLYSEPSDLLKNEVHVTVLVDFSGSMSGIRITNALKALRAILTSLDGESTFSVFKFGTSCISVNLDGNSVIMASPSNIQSVMSKILPVADMGGTNLLYAVQTVLDVGYKTSRRNNIMIITDGEIGATEASSVRSLLATKCPGNALAGIIGIGNDVTRATVKAVVDGGRGPQALVFDKDSEETIAENIVGATSALLATEFREVQWPSAPACSTSCNIVVNEQAVSASWAMYSDNCARASDVCVRCIVETVNIQEPVLLKIWTEDKLRSLTVDKLRKMLRSQVNTDGPSGGMKRKEDMIVSLLQKQSESAAKNALAVQAAADAYAEAVASNLERRRSISVPYFDVVHEETIKNMCIVAAVARANDFTCSALEAKQLALRYGFVGPKSDTVMVAISTVAAGDSCKATVAVGLPGSSSNTYSSGENLHSLMLVGNGEAGKTSLSRAAVWGYGSSGSPQDSGPSTWCMSASSTLPLYQIGRPLKPVAKCPAPKKPQLFSVIRGGVSKAKSCFAAKKSASMTSKSVSRVFAAKSAPKKCAAKKSASKSSAVFVPSFSMPLKVLSSSTPIKRARDSVSLLDILGALSGGLWRVSDPTVKMFIDNHCKSASKALVSDATVTIAVIAILRSKFSAFKKGWHVHVNRSKASARKAVGEDLYTTLKREFKASLL